MAIGTAAALIGGSALSGLLGSRSASKAANASAASSQAAIDEQRRQFDTILGLTAPQRNLGNAATNELSRLFGYAPQPQQNALLGPQQNFSQQQAYVNPLGFRKSLHNQNYGRDFGQNAIAPQVMPGGANQPINPGGPMGMDVFQTSPDYGFRKTEGLEGIAQTLGAGGSGAFSGNALRALNEYNSNLASGEFNDFVNRRLALAGFGQTASSTAANAAQNTGANVGNALMNQGDARASGILGQGAAFNNGINGALNALILKRQGLF